MQTVSPGVLGLAASAELGRALIDGEARTATLPRFNPNLGRLVSVVLSAQASLDGVAQFENAVDSPATVGLTMGGSFSLTGPGLSLVGDVGTTVLADLALPAFDGALDLAGPGLVMVGSDRLHGQGLAASELSDETGDLAAYVGEGYFSVVYTPAGFAEASDQHGNVLVQTELSAGARVSVAYRYVPYAVSGFVYLDGPRANGLFDAGEPTIPNVTLVLTGLTTEGEPVGPHTTVTDTAGAYLFTGLSAGTYVVRELHPQGYLDGDETRGNIEPLRAVVGSDTIDAIAVGPSRPHAEENNFGERLPSAKTQFLVTPHVRGIHDQSTRIELRFAQALDPGQALKLAHYRVATAGRDGRFGTNDDAPVAIKSARYDARRRLVTLQTKSNLSLNRDYLIRLKGPAGLLLVGQEFVGGTATGGDFETIVQRGKRVSVTEPDGDRVTVSASTGGIVELYRKIDGSLATLYVLNGSSRGKRLMPGKSWLDGTVSRQGRGDGKAALGTVIMAAPLRIKWNRGQFVVKSTSVQTSLPSAGL